MPWLIAPYEGSQPLGGKNDFGNYHLQNQGKLLRGLLIRWSAAGGYLSLLLVSGVIKNMPMWSKKSCVTYFFFRHNLSKTIVINAADQHLTPFRPDCPNTGVVPRVRLREEIIFPVMLRSVFSVKTRWFISQVDNKRGENLRQLSQSFLIFYCKFLVSTLQSEQFVDEFHVITGIIRLISTIFLKLSNLIDYARI